MHSLSSRYFPMRLISQSRTYVFACMRIQIGGVEPARDHSFMFSAEYHMQILSILWMLVCLFPHFLEHYNSRIHIFWCFASHHSILGTVLNYHDKHAELYRPCRAVLNMQSCVEQHTDLQNLELNLSIITLLDSNQILHINLNHSKMNEKFVYYRPNNFSCSTSLNYIIYL